MPSLKNIKRAFQLDEYKGQAIDAYILSKDSVRRKLSNKEFVISFKKVKPNGDLTKKFATLMMIQGKPILILHIGTKEQREGLKMQKEINEKLEKSYERSESQDIEKANEAFIRLDWVNSLEDIQELIDRAYEERI